MKLIEFEKSMILNIDDKKVTIQPKCMYLFSDVIWEAFKQKLEEIIYKNAKSKDKQVIEKYKKMIIKTEDPIDKKLTRFNMLNFNKFTNPIILRTGGIGDLIALSSLATYLSDELKIEKTNLSFVSQEKYRAVFEWYKNPIRFISYFAPVASYRSKSIIEKNKLYKRYNPIFFEGVIENSNENWFNVQYDQIGIKELDKTYGRPILKTERINNKLSNIDLSKKSILVNPRSTAIIRSMMFEDIYNAIVSIIGDMDVNIYVHNRNLIDVDEEFIKNKNDDRIKVIEAKSLSDFFLDAYDVNVVVSVDSAIHHFREGICKPSIGFYGQFPFECRALYYKYTLSINIDSPCTKMPCYIHVNKPDQICQIEQDLINQNIFPQKYFRTAPCTNSIWNTTLNEQLILKIKDYLLISLR